MAVRDVLGVAPPQTPNTVVEAQGNSCFWLGPTEWLLVTSYQLRAEMERLLRAALTGVRSAVTDVSGGQTTIILRGRSARDVLAKGCPLDLHPRIFAVGQCAQSHLAKAPILLRMVDIAPAFEVVVRRSFADYVWLWIQDAASEYGVEIVA